MKNRKRTALILVPVFLVGLTGGIAWGQQGEGPAGRRAPGSLAPARRGGPRADEHWRGRQGAGVGVKVGVDRRGRQGLVKRMTKKLELTDEQVKKVKGVLTDARKKSIGLRAEARVAGIELREMVSQETVDKAKVGAKVDQIAKIRGDLLRARTDAALAVREVLTPEQMAKADGMLKRLLGGRKGRGRR